MKVTVTTTRAVLSFTLLAMLGGCVPTYKLIAPGSVSVAKNSMVVQPASAWNKVPVRPGDIPYEEHWTLNGPLLDSVAFVGALPDGKPLLVQRKKDDQQVPPFRANMTPDDLVSMIESYYRIGQGVNVFDVRSVEPVPFLGKQGLKLDYTYVGGDALPHKGRCVVEVVNGKLYLMRLDGASSHYFDAAALEFGRMISTAQVR